MLAVTPVIDYRTYTNDREAGDIHMIVHQYSTRARLLAANGHADNHVMAVEERWGSTDEEPDLRTLFRQMDAWLTAINEVPGDRPLAEQVVAAKPPALVDHCWDRRSEPLIKIDETQTFDGGGLCSQLYPAFPTARHVAGAPPVNNIVKCELKPIRLDDYAVTFTEDERAPARGDLCRRCVRLARARTICRRLSGHVAVIWAVTGQSCRSRTEPARVALTPSAANRGHHARSLEVR